MPIKTVAVVGAGTMGAGIAQVAAMSNFSVILRDIRQEYLDRGLQTISSSLQRDVEKDRISEGDKKEILGRIRPVIDLDALREADLLVEAINEDLEIKTELFSNLDSMMRPEVIL